MVLGFTYQEEVFRPVLSHPDCMLGSDGTTMAPHAKVQSGLAYGAFTWAAWFYRTFVRDNPRLSIQEGIRRFTSLPAQHLGLKDRGILREGAWADIAIFDAQTFGERGTTFEPEQTADGMKHVVVGGTVTLQNGKFTGQRNGHVLRHSNGR
jgi:N-acyl-D-aspartate/D-glutamate deacylase